MSMSRWSQASWESFLSQIFRPEQAFIFPHKIFRWNFKGIYEDCFFPVPCQHLLGGENILGKSIQEALPREAGRTLQHAFRRTLVTQSPRDLQLIFSKRQETRVAVVRLFPFQSGVMGFITDHFMDGRPVIMLSPKDPSLAFLQDVARV
ncbi:MAG: hypothetical protein AB7P17_12240 [Nitrospirales bacterium]|nr:hypothetical protein [Nitrospirales bacterium]